MLRVSAKVLHLALQWAESCSCHFHILHGDLANGIDASPLDVPANVRQAAQSCPLRGRRCPELAAGELMTLIASLYDVSRAAMLKDIPPELSASQRSNIISDYERARACLLGTFTVKLAHWQQPPYVMFGLAHAKPSVVMDSYHLLQQGASEHPRVQSLFADGLAEERVAFESVGGDWVQHGGEAFPTIYKYIAELRFALSAERVVEGLHAQVHRQVGLPLRPCKLTCLGLGPHSGFVFPQFWFRHKFDNKFQRRLGPEIRSILFRD